MLTTLAVISPSSFTMLLMLSHAGNSDPFLRCSSSSPDHEPEAGEILAMHLARVVVRAHGGEHGEHVRRKADELLARVAVLAERRAVGVEHDLVARANEHGLVHRLERDRERAGALVRRALRGRRVRARDSGARLPRDQHHDVDHFLVVRVGIVRLRLEHAEHLLAIDDGRAQHDGHSRQLRIRGALGLGDGGDVRLAGAKGGDQAPVGERFRVRSADRLVLSGLPSTPFLTMYSEPASRERIVSHEHEAGRIDDRCHRAIALRVDVRERYRGGDRLLHLGHRREPLDALLHALEEERIAQRERAVAAEVDEQRALVGVEALRRRDSATRAAPAGVPRRRAG